MHKLISTILKIGLAAIFFGFVGAAPTFASSEHSYQNNFQAYFKEANNSGVSGKADVWWEGEKLKVKVTAWGLEKGKDHPSHIHGFSNDRTSRCATPKDDYNHNGLIDLQEAVATGGGVMVDLGSHNAPDGKIAYERIYTVDKHSLQPLNIRVIEIHGKTVNGHYDPTLPVACGMIYPTKGEHNSKYSDDNHKKDYQSQKDNHYSKGKGDYNKSDRDYGHKYDKKKLGYNRPDHYGRHNQEDYDRQNKVSYEHHNRTWINQSNEANITNNVNATSNTGYNSASGNTRGHVSIRTGDAHTNVSISNNANSNIIH